MIRLKLIDLLTQWHIERALKEIYSTQYNPQKLQEIIACRIKKLSALAKKIQPCNAGSIELFPVTDKIFHKDHSPINKEKSSYLIKKTGGSTGAPFAYRANRESQGFLWASIIRSWNEVGYKVGDPIAFLAGSSVIGAGYKKAIFYNIMRITPLSSSGIDHGSFKIYADRIKTKGIKYLYGYSNSIYLFAKYIKSSGVKLNLEGVVCTAEQLNDSSRDFIERTFQAKVIRQYGANDGGISSFECSHKNGYHVITNRCLIEEVDGNIITTDLINDAQLFIRYSVGDKGVISSRPCPCGINYPRVTELKGKENDFVYDLSKKAYHSSFFTSFFRSYPFIEQWQIICSEGCLDVNIHTSGTQGVDKMVKKFNDYMARSSGFKEINIILNKDFELLRNNKLKFVIQK